MGTQNSRTFLRRAKSHVATRILATLLTFCLGGSAATARGCNREGRSDVLGVNINNLTFSTLRSPNLIAALRQSNAGWIRINFYWANIERSPGKFDWGAIDEGVAKLRKANINLIVTLYGPVPCWALTDKENCKGPQWTAPPTGPWMNFVQTAVKRYVGKVNHWEIWNEPNLVYALNSSSLPQRLADYRDKILIPGARAVHSSDPTARVIAPALATGTGGAESPASMARLLETILTPEARKLVDAVSIHVYAPNDPTVYGKAARDEMQQLGMNNASLWLTETGALSSPVPRLSQGLVGQEAFLHNQFSRALQSGIYNKIFWFALTDSTNSARGHGNSFGLIDNENYVDFKWTPRPSFEIFQDLTRQSCTL